MNRPRCAKRNHTTGGSSRSMLLAVFWTFPGATVFIIPVLNELAEGNTSSYLAHLPVTMLPANFHLCRKFTIGRNNIDMSPLYVYDQETACYSFVS